jgi:putative ABC transport system substrate-binding protein
VRRRRFIAFIGISVVAVPLDVLAQPTHPIPKIGWLKIQGRLHTPSQLQAFRKGLKALALIEGRDFVLEERYADGDEKRLPGLAADLINSRNAPSS